MKAAYIEVLTDTLSSAAVIVAAIIISVTGALWIDPLLSVGIAVFILPRAFLILRQATHILLEGTPRDLDDGEVRQALLKVPGVQELHDFHYWTLTSGMNCASVHVRATNESDYGQLRDSVAEVFREKAGVSHVTVQIENAEDHCIEERQHLRPREDEPPPELQRSLQRPRSGQPLERDENE